MLASRGLDEACRVRAISLAMSAADPARTAALRTIRGQFPVLAFYSHTKRTPFETAEDDKYGIDRRAFSNLHVEEFFVPSLPQHLVLHSLTNSTNGPSVEHFFQAMKCVKCCDALLLLQVVQDPNVIWRGGISLCLTP